VQLWGNRVHNRRELSSPVIPNELTRLCALGRTMHSA
jgi:hypothetical protein